jgi:ribosome modulation factor
MMKRHKRERSELLYSRGFNAGITGRSQEMCPYQDINLRQHWMAGWREGRVNEREGFQGIAALHLSPRL